MRKSTIPIFTGGRLACGRDRCFAEVTRILFKSTQAFHTEIDGIFRRLGTRMIRSEVCNGILKLVRHRREACMLTTGSHLPNGLDRGCNLIHPLSEMDGERRERSTFD